MALIELLAKLQEAGLSEIESYALLARFLEEEAELFAKCTKYFPYQNDTENKTLPMVTFAYLYSNLDVNE